MIAQEDLRQMAGLLAVSSREAVGVLDDQRGADLSACSMACSQVWAAVALVGGGVLVLVFADDSRPRVLRAPFRPSQLGPGSSLCRPVGLGGVEDGRF